MQVQEFGIRHKREIKDRRGIVMKGCPRTPAVAGKRSHKPDGQGNRVESFLDGFYYGEKSFRVPLDILLG